MESKNHVDRKEAEENMVQSAWGNVGRASLRSYRFLRGNGFHSLHEIPVLEVNANSEVKERNSCITDKTGHSFFFLFDYVEVFNGLFMMQIHSS